MLDARLSAICEKVIVADDHPIFAGDCAGLYKKITGTIVLEASNRDELLECASGEPKPHLMLLDFNFPGFSGVGSISQMRKLFPTTIIIVVSMTDDEDLVASIMEAGVNGFISKSIPPDILEASVRSVLQGEVVVKTTVGDTDLNVPNDTQRSLSARQLDVLVGLTKGMSNKEMARELGISPHTVRAHISALYIALNVNSRSGAVVAATDAGII